MRVLNKYKDAKSWTTVYIGRGSVFGNPYVIGEHGTREAVIAMYDKWLTNKILQRDVIMLGALRQLTKDSDLMCFCKPVPCHGDVIQRIWEEISSHETWDAGVDAFIARHGKNYLPVNDGVDHINVYSRGNTELGRWLSNFARAPFIHPLYGVFESIEGFWYWLGTGKSVEALRGTHGLAAKRLGKQYLKVPCDNFEEEIRQAITYKLEQHPQYLKMLRESSLPLAHYYYYGEPENCKIITMPQFDWIIEHLEHQRV